jgi:flagellar biosynthetic protein FliR
MALIHVPLVQIQLFMLALVRVGVILFTLPLFDSRSIPPIAKIGLALAVTLVLVPLLDVKEMPLITEVPPFVLGIATEVILGLAISMSVRLLFTGIQLAGQLAGYQMGFGVVNVMDPISNSQASIIAQVNYLMAAMIFLSIDAHHWMLYAMAESFTVIPPLNFQVNSALVDLMMKSAAGMFTIAIKIGAPIIVALLLTSVMLGVVARTVPQMNIFIVAFPLKIAVGFVFILLTLPHMTSFLQEVFSGIGKDILMIVNTGK